MNFFKNRQSNFSVIVVARANARLPLSSFLQVLNQILGLVVVVNLNISIKLNPFDNLILPLIVVVVVVVMVDAGL